MKDVIKTWIFFTFLLFLLIIFVLLGPDPERPKNHWGSGPQHWLNLMANISYTVELHQACLAPKLTIYYSRPSVRGNAESKILGPVHIKQDVPSQPPKKNFWQVPILGSKWYLSTRSRQGPTFFSSWQMSPWTSKMVHVVYPDLIRIQMDQWIRIWFGFRVWTLSQEDRNFLNQHGSPLSGNTAIILKPRMSTNNYVKCSNFCWQ